MKVITSKPIVFNGKVMNEEMYSNFPDTTGQPFGMLAPVPSNAPLGQQIPTITSTNATTMSRAERIKAGLDKAKGVYQKGQDSGLFASIGNLLGLGKKDTPAVAPAVAPAPEVKPDNTMKYVLIGGGVLAVGVIVYLATRKK